jgi:GAF domain
MDHHSIIDRSSTSPRVEQGMLGASASRSVTASVSAGVAAANAHLPQRAESGPPVPGENGGRSLAEMACRDLDAALQLLAERAQYITAADGAAIALRRSEHQDMLCRASVGSNAPELGALLSMEYGLSGESVRTRLTQRCDDTEHDSRVNREGCRQLGIASVVVMPIVSDEQVFGVFELFSGKPRAFVERDISALRRLSEMVETAVKHAVAAQSVIAAEEPIGAEPHLPVEETAAAALRVDSPVTRTDAAPPPVTDLHLKGLSAANLPPEPIKVEMEKPEEKPEPEKAKAEPVPKKPLFWSAVMQTSSSAKPTDDGGESIVVPPVLRNLRKCQACGFPVSQGRTLCVECEEKQWRGQRLP